MKTLFGEMAAHVPESSVPAMRAEGMRSLEASRAAFRVAQWAQYGIGKLSDSSIARYIAFSEEHAAAFAELSAAANDNARHDRLRQLGTQSVTAVATAWLRRSHPEQEASCLNPLRGFASPKWMGNRGKVWCVRESDPLFLLWNVLTMNRMTEANSREKLDAAGELDIWDQSLAKAVREEQLTDWTRRWPEKPFLAIDLSFLPDARAVLRPRDYEKGAL